MIDKNSQGNIPFPRFSQFELKSFSHQRSREYQQVILHFQQETEADPSLLESRGKTSLTLFPTFISGLCPAPVPGALSVLSGDFPKDSHVFAGLYMAEKKLGIKDKGAWS